MVGFGCLDDGTSFLTEVYEHGRKLWILSMPLKGFRVFLFARNEYFAGSPWITNKVAGSFTLGELGAVGSEGEPSTLLQRNGQT